MKQRVSVVNHRVKWIAKLLCNDCCYHMYTNGGDLCSYSLVGVYEFLDSVQDWWGFGTNDLRAQT
jgi:hypothetical protein